MVTRFITIIAHLLRHPSSRRLSKLESNLLEAFLDALPEVLSVSIRKQLSHFNSIYRYPKGTETLLYRVRRGVVQWPSELIVFGRGATGFLGEVRFRSVPDERKHWFKVFLSRGVVGPLEFSSPDTAKLSPDDIDIDEVVLEPKWLERDPDPKPDVRYFGDEGDSFWERKERELSFVIDEELRDALLDFDFSKSSRVILYDPQDLQSTHYGGQRVIALGEVLGKLGDCIGCFVVDAETNEYLYNEFGAMQLHPLGSSISEALERLEGDVRG